jgi:HEAT repeat protein
MNDPTRQFALTILSMSCLVAGCSCMTVSGATAEQVVEYKDLADRSEKTVIPGQVYRMGQSGICGTVEEDHILVTHVIPGTPADGKIQKGDLVRGMQHRGMGGWGGIRGLVGVRMYRIGRDWDWHFYVTVERQSLRGGKGNTVTYDLLMPPDPGNVCHYGPTGFFAKRHADHLVVEVVEAGSPADGKLEQGDAIVAVNGQPVGLDAYHQFTEAVDKAESEQGGGVLKLTVELVVPAKESTPNNQRPTANAQLKNPNLDVGRSMLDVGRSDRSPLEPLIVTLNIPVLGSYSKTAPVDCKKTERLIAQTADHIVDNKKYGQLNWGALGLLATGEGPYIKVVRDYLHAAEWAQPPADVNALLKAGGYVSWHWGYRNLLMTEYYLLTGDTFVLPAITQLSRTLAAGQDQAGLWGHRMAHPELGRAYGYGIMNQPTIPIFISLILAEKCGVKDPAVREAIERTHGHYDKWVGRGALPYGNHGPSQGQFTNNGTSGSLAVALALLGNQKGAAFYAAMSAAASEEILLGHGGPKWNILWSGLGANVAGPKMAAAYNRKIHWLRTVTRRWDGRYCEIFGWGSAAKSDASGSHLLNLCAGRRAISITGKGMAKTLWVAAAEAEAVIVAGVIDDTTDEALLKALGDRFPPVRVRAAQALAMRDGDVSDKVMALLADGTPHQQVGAIHAIKNLKVAGAEDELLALVKDEKADLWVRQIAAGALGSMDEAKPYATELLKLLVADKPYDQPYRELDLALGGALVKLYEPDPYATDLDKELFYRGVTTLLDHKHASGRGAGMNLLKNLPMEDLPRMLDKVVYLIEDKDKTYTAYTGSGRQEALEILYRLGIKESMDYTVNTIKEPTGRGGPRQRARTRLLKTFGAEAKYLVPRIREVLGKGADEIVTQIEASTTPKQMITLEEAKQAARK